MTVRELIEALQQLPQDAIVVTSRHSSWDESGPPALIKLVDEGGFYNEPASPGPDEEWLERMRRGGAAHAVSHWTPERLAEAREAHARDLARAIDAVDVG